MINGRDLKVDKAGQVISDIAIVLVTTHVNINGTHPPTFKLSANVILGIFHQLIKISI